MARILCVVEREVFRIRKKKREVERRTIERTSNPSVNLSYLRKKTTDSNAKDTPMAEDDDFDIDAWVEVRFFNILKLGFLFSSKSGFGCLV